MVLLFPPFTYLTSLVDGNIKEFGIKGIINDIFEFIGIFIGDLNKISSITNINKDEIKSYLNFNEDVERVKIRLNSINKGNLQTKLNSFTPGDLKELVKLLDKLN